MRSFAVTATSREEVMQMEAANAQSVFGGNPKNFSKKAHIFFSSFLAN
jgi:hypothetical protein